MAFVPIIRPEKHKTTASIMGAMGHHLRTIPTSNADKIRTPNNLPFIGDSPRDVANLVKKRTEHLVKRKDANRAIELFLGASDEYWEGGKGDPMELSEAYLGFLKAEFGEENIVAFGLHMDESKPHFYAMITPIFDGKLNSGHWFDGPVKLSKMLDRLALHLKPLGFERGQKGVKATHLDVSTWHEAQSGNVRARKEVEAEMLLRHTNSLIKTQKAEKKAFETALEVEQLEVKKVASKAVADMIVSEALARTSLLEDQLMVREKEVQKRESFVIQLAEKLDVQRESLRAAFDQLSFSFFEKLPQKLQDQLMRIFDYKPVELKIVPAAPSALPSEFKSAIPPPVLDAKPRMKFKM